MRSRSALSPMGAVLCLAAIAVLTASSATAGEVVVTSDPPGAEVQLGGRSVGVSPVDVADVAPGPCLVRVQLQGYIPYQRELTVDAEKPAKVHANLIRDASLTPQAAAAPAPGHRASRVRFSIGGGVALRGAETRFSDTWSAGETKDQSSGSYYTYHWVWSSSWDATYRSSSTPIGPDVSADVWFSDRLGVGLGWERFNQDLATEPKYKFDLAETVTYRYGAYTSTYTNHEQNEASATADDYTYRQSVVHLALTWRQPVADRVHLEVSAGPSFFKAEQQLTRKVLDLSSCQESSSSPTYRYTGCRLVEDRTLERGSSVGFNVGAALAFQLQPKLELVVQARYAASGAIKLDAMDTEWLVDAVDAAVPYQYNGAATRTKVSIKTGTFLPRLTLRYTF